MRKVDLSSLKAQLPRGYTTKISRAIGISPQAVSIALRKSNPNLLHPAVKEAIRLRAEHQKALRQVESSLEK